MTNPENMSQNTYKLAYDRHVVTIGQLTLLPSAGQERAQPRCSCRERQGWLTGFVDKRVGDLLYLNTQELSSS